MHGGGVSIWSEECIPRRVKRGTRGWCHHLVYGVFPHVNEGRCTEGFPSGRRNVPLKESIQVHRGRLPSGRRSVLLGGSRRGAKG